MIGTQEDDQPLVSVILPVYDEDQNLTTLYDRLAKVAAAEPVRWEFLFVDDGSHDHSFELLKELHSRDSRVKILRFSRNFGAHEACVAGLREASGDCVIIMASDLQDPPELIPELLRQWRSGYQVVWAARTRREDPFLRRTSARLYYALIRKLAIPDYPKEGTGSFCAIGRPVIDALNLLEERNRVTFELILWCGYQSTQVPYVRPPRLRGFQKWTFARNVKAAIDGLLALSYAPIRMIFSFGLIVAALSFIYALYIFCYALFHGTQTLGWASLMVSLLFLGGTQLMCLGFLGEYMWRILQECRRRPLYLVRDRIGEFGRGKHPMKSSESDRSGEEHSHEYAQLARS